MAETTLREALNKVSISGILKEKNLKIDTNTKGKYIGGYVIIQTDEHSAHRVNVFSFEKTNKGEVSGIFKGLKTAMDEYVSLVDCTDQGLPESEATKIVITSGRLGLNEYYDEGGNLKSSWSVSSSFLSRPRSETGFEPMATFEVEGFISAIRTNDRDQTFIELVIPTYGGNVVPITFSTTAIAADYIKDNYERGQTGKFLGDLVNIAEVEVKPYMGFGEGRPTKTVNFKRDIVITGGDPAPYDEDDEKSYKPKAIKEALVAREEYLENLKTKGKDKGNKEPNVTKPATTTKKTSGFDW